MERLAQISLSQSLPVVPAETVNAWTHGLGWGLSAVGSVALIRNAMAAGDALTTAGCAVYAASLLLLYAASTLSHACEDVRWKSLFRMWDQVCIFLMIAGSFTPFALSHLRTTSGWTLLSVMWGLTFVGAAIRIRSGERPVAFPWYVALAWMPVLILGDVLAITGTTGLMYVLAGGGAYMFGLWFFVNDYRHPYFHAVWHCSVILGSGLHFLFHYRFVII
ncbi:MAG: hemolysin III family protein [Planctomycetaceae bacterium]|nr:hemolysin III family protein [Planctomycetaceae bacterium]